jgi:hypothetical protein
MGYPYFSGNGKKAHAYQGNFSECGELLPSITTLGNFQAATRIIEKIGKEAPARPDYWDYVRTEIKPLFEQLAEVQEAVVVANNLFTIGFWNAYRQEIPSALIEAMLNTSCNAPPGGPELSA